MNHTTPNIDSADEKTGAAKGIISAIILSVPLWLIALALVRLVFKAI